MKVTEKWLNERKKGVGGSDVADVLSLPPYGCAARLWDEKRSVAPDFKPERNPNMERGVMLEDIVRQIYQEQTGNKVNTSKALKSVRNPFMLGNVDGIILKPDNQGKKKINLLTTGVLEIKCPTRDNYTRIRRIGLPEGYILQMQHYLYVAQKQWGHWAIFCADMWQLEPVYVERDDELIKMIIEAAERFWIMVENGPRPERLEWGDKRCKKCIRRITCWGAKWEDSEDEEEESEDEYEEIADDEFLDACQEHKEHIEMLKSATEFFDESKAKLIEIVGDNEKVRCDEAKISYKWGKYRGVDLDRLRSDHPDLIEKYKYTSATRPFRFYGKE